MRAGLCHTQLSFPICWASVSQDPSLRRSCVACSIVSCCDCEIHALGGRCPGHAVSSWTLHTCCSPLGCSARCLHPDLCACSLPSRPRRLCLAEGGRPAALVPLHVATDPRERSPRCGTQSPVSTRCCGSRRPPPGQVARKCEPGLSHCPLTPP